MSAVVLSDLRVFTKKPFDTSTFMDIVERYQITNVNTPPSQISLLLNSEEFLSSNTQSLQTFMVVGSIFSKTMREKFEKHFPDKIVMIPYGMTETFVSMSKPSEYRIEFSVGSILFPNVQVKIVDDDGKTLDVGQRGEICAKSGFKFLVS
jgi:acyl-coenzyme A synthetase/AMP-(fatty) acid ligase